MTSNRLRTQAVGLALGLASLALAAKPSFAVELAAVPAEWTPLGGGTPIAMWAYVDASPSAGSFACPAAPVAWQNGPTVNATAGSPLTVNIKNCLSDAVSVFIPGQYKATAPVTFNDPEGRSRVRSFDAETAAGAVGSYTWTSVKEGTYLYHSGTHPQVQVQMGLYGALVVSGGTYPTAAAEHVLLYSEIDPELHAAVATGIYGAAPGPTSTFDYYPQYFLINGKSHPGTTPIAVDTSSNVLLRFVNAGLKTHSPTLGGGLYMTLVAEDGNLYPFPVEQYGLELPAAKTIDAVLNVGADGTYPLYDRDLHLANSTATGGGMLVYIEAMTAAGAPTAANDSYSVAEDGTLTATAGDLTYPGVLDNDTAGGPLTASLVSNVAAGTLALSNDGSFTYTPNSNFNGNDQFAYVANEGGPNSNVATVIITVTPVNDAAVASLDGYNAIAGQMLSVAAPGVLGNDSDIDGDTLTAVQFGAAPAGTLVLNPNGSFNYTPAGAAGAVESFQYVANDGTVDSTPATVTITVAAPPNSPPVAVDDNTSTPRNTPLLNFNVVANDSDPNGNATINASSVVITSGTTTTRGGTVINNGNGTVTYTPKNGFRGTDTFTYTVKDNLGATSNVATVRVNVTK